MLSADSPEQRPRRPPDRQRALLEYLSEAPDNVRTVTAQLAAKGILLDGLLWATWELRPAEQYRLMTTKGQFHALHYKGLHRGREPAKVYGEYN